MHGDSIASVHNHNEKGEKVVQLHTAEPYCLESHSKPHYEYGHPKPIKAPDFVKELEFVNQRKSLKRKIRKAYRRIAF
jgi:hypothetical protein